jgi:transposase
VALCRALPDGQAAPMLTVLANVAWWLGDGALARTALERALAVEPGYRLARLLDRMVVLAIRPRVTA